VLGVLERVAVRCSVTYIPRNKRGVCCSLVCCNVLQCVAVCCSVLQCVAVCCSVLFCDIYTAEQKSLVRLKLFGRLEFVRIEFVRAWLLADYVLIFEIIGIY